MVELLLNQNTQEISSNCHEESRQKLPKNARSFCFELFRRAFDEADERAWAALQSQYHKLTISWIHKASGNRLEPAVIEDLTQDTFIRFWRTLTKRSAPFEQYFKHIGAILGYLKRCAVTTYLDWQRRASREARLTAVLKNHDGYNPQLRLEQSNLENQETIQVVQQWIHKNVTDDRDRLVLQLSFEKGLKPSAIAAEYPQLFSGALEVRRMKERILKRIRRSLK